MLCFGESVVAVSENCFQIDFQNSHKCTLVSSGVATPSIKFDLINNQKNLVFVLSLKASLSILVDGIVACHAKALKKFLI